MRKSLIRALVLLGALACSSAAWADAGGPLLLLVNLFAFSVGQVWILFAEYVYLFVRLPSVPPGRLFKLVVLVNLWSTVGGAILIPFVWAAVFLGLSAATSNNRSMSDVLGYLGTWIVPGNSEFAWLAFPASAFVLVLTFIATIFIEYKLMARWKEKYALPDPPLLKKFAIEMNAVSYAGLVLIFGIGIWAKW